MPIINVQPVVIALGGSETANGYITFTPWAGNGPAVVTSGAVITFPEPITVQVTNGVPAQEIDIPANDGVTWCWRAVAYFAGLSEEIYFNLTADADWGALVKVDQATFQPSGDVVAAWEAAGSQVVALADQIAASTVTFTPDPDNADLLIATYPAAMLADDGTSLIVPVEN